MVGGNGREGDVLASTGGGRKETGGGPQVYGELMRPIVKYVVILTAVFAGLVVLLLAWSIHADQERFGAAKNDCERGCIQDSGGLDQCRQVCVNHPDRYP